MSVTIGARLGPYEILAALGAGGMGEVYRARDTKLNRDVAIKVLLPALANDPDRLARFSREAQVLASLNHPNIAHIHGLEESNGVTALVMELVEGEDLSQRIARGAIPIDEALPIARQIAEALEAAHDHGIIHRDLKPANVKVRPDGTVKVLDFGLAKAVDPNAGSNVGAMNSPTLSIHATQAGVILGTAAYMSPEQARGKSVDKRTDIWALGAIVYEMLCGRRAFAGEELSDILAAVLRQEIDWTALPLDTPSSLKRLLERCLDRDPRTRLRDVGEARVQMAAIETTVGQDESLTTTSPVRSGSTLRWLMLLTLAMLAAAVAAWRLKPVTTAAGLHLSIALPPGEQVTTVPAISPDGRIVAYVAGRTAASSQLYIRSLADFTPLRIAGSAGALYPFFSPDGRSVAFFSGGQLQRVPVDGGVPKRIVPVGSAWGGTWTDDDQIAFSTLSGGLWTVPAIGGPLRQLTKPDGGAAGYGHTFPERLLGTTDLLFSFWGQQFQMARVNRKTGAWRAITSQMPSATGASGTTADGFLLVHDGAGDISAVAWSPDATATVHPETVVLDHVYWISGIDRPWLSVADNGTAVYVPGDPSNRQLVWIDRGGRIAQFGGEPAPLSHAKVSPDGRRVAYGNATALWVVDLDTGAQTRLRSDMNTLAVAWTPDSRRLVVSSNISGDWEIYTIVIIGQGELTPLLKKPFAQHPLDVAPDGTVIEFERHPETGADLWTLRPDGTTSPLLITQFNEFSARVSADGRYVAYVSDESGRNEVYAIPLSGKGDRVPISLGAGTGPVWSRDGRELFYRGGDDLISVAVRTVPTLVLGERRKLLDLSAYDPTYFHEFDVSADGQRFLLIRTEPASRPVRLNVMLNWVETLKTKLLAK